MLNKRRKILCLTIATLGASFIYGCGKSEKEVVWYIEDPHYYDVEGEAEPYQELQSERFTQFNERLKELNIPANVVFKYLPSMREVGRKKEVSSEDRYKQELAFAGRQIETLLQEDPEADIVLYQPIEYQEFLPLDTYLEKEENKKVKQALPEAIWNANRAGETTYQIPKGNVAINETTYRFYKPFLEQYDIALDTEKIRQMTPQEVIAYFQPYFEQEKLLDGRYCLTSAEDLRYETFLWSEYSRVILGLMDFNIVVQEEERKAVNFLETAAAQEKLKLEQWIYETDLDAHVESQKQNIQLTPIFQMSDIPTIEELSKEQDSEWLEVPLGNRRVATSIGNGVLKDSKEKELAVQVLAASMYDEELSNLMIYGIAGKDYELKDGYAVTEEEGLSCMGSFSQIGNNLIAYPSKVEVKEKKEKTEALLQDVSKKPSGTFAPVWKPDIWEKMLDVAQIYRDIDSTVGLEEIPNLDTYLEEQMTRLKEAGVDEVVADLQEQVERWKE